MTAHEPWRRTLYIVWGAQFIAMLGMSLVVPFLPFYIRSLGVTNEADVSFWSGFVFAGPFLPAFLLTPVWGYLGDKYGRKLMTVRAVFGLGLSQLLIGFAPSVEVLLLFRMVQGAISGFLAAALALVSSQAPRHRSGYAIGLLQTATSLGSVLGPLFGGTLADALGFRPVFFITSGLCIVTGLIIIRFVSEAEHERPSAEQKTSIWSNVRFVVTHSSVRIALLLIVVSQSAVFIVQPVFALYIDHMVGSTEFVATLAGSIFSVAGVFTVLSAPWWGRRGDEKSTRKNLTLAFSGAAVAYLLHFFATHPLQLIVLRAILGFCLGGMLPSLYSYVNKHTSSRRRGGVLGIATSGNTLANLLAAPIGGIIGARFGFREVFLFAFVLLMTAVWTVRSFLPDVQPEMNPTPEPNNV